MSSSKPTFILTPLKLRTYGRKSNLEELIFRFRYNLIPKIAVSYFDKCNSRDILKMHYSSPTSSVSNSVYLKEIQQSIRKPSITLHCT